MKRIIDAFMNPYIDVLLIAVLLVGGLMWAEYRAQKEQELGQAQQVTLDSGKLESQLTKAGFLFQRSTATRLNFRDQSTSPRGTRIVRLNDPRLSYGRTTTVQGIRDRLETIRGKFATPEEVMAYAVANPSGFHSLLSDGGQIVALGSTFEGKSGNTFAACFSVLTGDVKMGLRDVSPGSRVTEAVMFATVSVPAEPARMASVE